MSSVDLEEDQVVKAPFLPEPSVIKNLETRGSHIQLDLVTQDSKEYMEKVLTPEQVDQIDLVQEKGIDLVDDAKDFFHFIEANRIRFSHQFDPLLAVHVSQVDPLPHQIEAVYEYILDQPKVRFLLADDPGAGKTIMAGLALKEMEQRKLVDRCLIVSPGHLQEQWQREMKEKFRTRFKIIQREGIRSSWAENIFEERNYCITSMDFAKQDDVMHHLENVHWDLVIVDEAHKMAAYKQGDKIEKTQRYNLGELLTANTINMLFLTATPHKGDEENFRLFLDLLEPGMFSDTRIMEKVLEDDDNKIFLRRLKEDLRDLDGKKIFPKRQVRTVKFTFSRQEKRLYEEVTEYVQDYFDKAKENRHITFALMIMQRRLSSSVSAILESLKRRKSKLEDLLELPRKIRESEEYRRIRELSDEELEEEMADMPEQERQRIEERMEKLTYAENIDQVKAEIRQLERLIKQAKETKENQIESKLRKLKDDILEPLGDKKLLIFTQFTDTLDYLVGQLRSWGYAVTTIHGGMSLQARIDAEKEFKHETQIMVATEAAGEGINLQFCSWMVNYDIPWNPNRLEQRMGRVHRYGQDETVNIFNLITTESAEGHILDRLFNKLNQMRNHLGSDQVFDVIGELFEEHDLGDMIEEAITEQRTLDEITDDIEALTAEETEERIQEIFLKSLAREHIDTATVSRRMTKAQENRLVPEYIRAYFLSVFDKMEEASYRDHDRYVNVTNVPYELRKLNKNESFKNRYGKVRRNYKRVVFEKRNLESDKDEFVAPGHPLLEAVNEQVLSDVKAGPQKCALFGDPDNERDGVIWFVMGEVTEGDGEPAGRRIFAIERTKDDDLKEVNPGVLWDLKPIDNPDTPGDLSEEVEEPFQVNDYVMENVLLPYKQKLQEQRNRSARIKEEYGKESLEQQILELESKNLDFQQRVDQGEDAVKGQITMNERKIEDLENKKKRLEREIQSQRNLSISAPEILGTALVQPLDDVSDSERKGRTMVRNEEIEEIAMNRAMRFEREQNLMPESVEEENLGFDIRSLKEKSENKKNPEVARYVEVKGRAETGKISLTPNEWMKAERFGEMYWLYVVFNTSSEPDLKRIQNPASKFDKSEIVKVKRYEIPFENWRNIS